MRKNTDGTVDIYFGPEAPAGQEFNWLHTSAGTAGSLVSTLWS